MFENPIFEFDSLKAPGLFFRPHLANGYYRLDDSTALSAVVDTGHTRLGRGAEVSHVKRGCCRDHAPTGTDK